MKRINNIKLFALCGLCMAGAFYANAQKRGVSENQFQFVQQIEALEGGVFWYYNWGNTEGGSVIGQETLEYVPMCWNGNYNKDAIREYCAAHPQTKYILGFNEPNFKAQANMTPAEAAERWPEVQALAAELNLKIVAPALNYSPNEPYQDPLKWMDEFVALVGNDAFDYTAVHAYGGFGVMSDLATKFHDRYGKDVWVTEFCYWPEEGNTNSTVSPENQIAFMMQAVEWLEKTEWIYRYSWFKAVGNSSASKGPNYGLLMPGKGEEPRELSQQGLVYVNMSDFNPEKYHDINKIVAASEYISQSASLLGESLNPGCPSPIEIVRFNAGATLDYQFDVPQAGDYTLILTVSGEGEPTRFDPNIGIFAVNADGSEGKELSASKTFTLPNDNAEYIKIEFPLTLEAGKQTIRISDTNPYQPSGIRISTLNLTNGAGMNVLNVNGSSEFVDVYTLQGTRVKSHVKAEEASVGLPSGIYIIGNRKVKIQ